MPIQIISCAVTDDLAKHMADLDRREAADHDRDAYEEHAYRHYTRTPEGLAELIDTDLMDEDERLVQPLLALLAVCDVRRPEERVVMDRAMALWASIRETATGAAREAARIDRGMQVLEARQRRCLNCED